MSFNCNWSSAPVDFSLSGDDVHIWCTCLNFPHGLIERMAQILSNDELKRAERFHFRRHRTRFIAAHAFLRKLLAEYANIEAKRITFEYGSNGKPFLSEKFSQEKIRFNLSHSRDYALMAFARNREIGVDLEYIKEFADMYTVAKQVFSSKDNAVLQLLAETERMKAFYTFWTRKEAYLKAIGKGLSAALDTIDISSDSLDESIIVLSEGTTEGQNQWTIQDLNPLAGFAAAFAIEGTGAIHHCWDLKSPP
jgi:4'-phosphopantetheinyl transferase